jgi:signal transduction histidine kinase
VAALVLLTLLAARTQWVLWHVDHDWDRFRVSHAEHAARTLRDALDRTSHALIAQAERALGAPDDSAAAFAYLGAHTSAAPERGVVLFRAGHPSAWAGTIRVPVDSLTAVLGTTATPFYLAVYAAAQRGDERAVATALISATPPADHLAAPLDRDIARHAQVPGFSYALMDRPTSDSTVVVLPAGGAAPRFIARPDALAPDRARLDVLENALLQGVVLLGIALAVLMGVVWRRMRGLAPRLTALAVVLACLGITPLNLLSNESRLLDPALYFASLGGPFTASPAAFAMSASLVLLGLLVVLRSPTQLRSRPVALGLVLVIAGLGPFLMRDLARGISSPGWGVSTSLWLTWEGALFLIAVAVLLAGATAGRAALGPSRGLHAVIAPALAVVAALLGPITWDVGPAWPAWYPVLWVGAIGALALTRRSRPFMLAAATVAALGSATLVWGTSVRRRVTLAEQDVAGLRAVDQSASQLLKRFGDELRQGEPPRNRAALLRRYVQSDLAAANYPLEISAWDCGTELTSTLSLSQFRWDTSLVASLVGRAERLGSPVDTVVQGQPGVLLVLVVPHDTSAATSVVLAPRTRLIVDDPFLALLGMVPEATADPPYTVVTTEADLRVSRANTSPGDGLEAHWERLGSELHGDWILESPGGGAASRAHVEVELRPLPELVQRGALVVLFDLAIVAALWALSAAADGGLGRWWASRRRVWARSYRARLTIALFAFFVLPAFGFTVWSYRGLQTGDRQSRDLLVRETLRAATLAENDPDGAASVRVVSQRLSTPLFLYEDGQLRESSDSLYDELVPLGRFLPPAIFASLAIREELSASDMQQVGASRALIGYRVRGTPGGARQILAVPGRTDEVTLDRRRSDLGVLLLFALAVGALSALWLSGVAAREFARPISALRDAALAIAEGRHEPPLEGAAPAEFVPVFTAFRRMDADLSESRDALEEAQRRITAILRNVASGVIAVDRGLGVTLANPRAQALLGDPMAPGTLLPAVGDPPLDQLVGRFLERPDADEEEFEIEAAGRQFRGRVTRLSRGAAGAVVTLDDVTELARAQRVLAWGEMARQVAHEIKNPLTPIRLGVQHLRRARADARSDFDRILEQNVGRILEEIDRLDEIARAFSRYGMAPSQQSPGQPVDVAEIVRDLLALETLGEGGVQWGLRDADAPAVARASPGELREVLLNILENARLAGAHAVDVRVVRDAAHVTIVVTDDGEGISAELLPRIFEPHFSTRTSGSGLGLAISRRLIEGWGGTITVSSERGAGTRVEIGLRAE